ASQFPVNQTRSYARWGHYERAKSRSNYHILIGHKAKMLQLSEDLNAEGVSIFDRESSTNLTINAKLEIILAAGATHTLQLLHLSGIGPREILDQAGIRVRVDLPGVGQNMQDHPQMGYSCVCSTHHSAARVALLGPGTDHINSGPLTLALTNQGAFLPLRTVNPGYRDFISKPTSDPVVEFRTFSNPLDMQQAISFIRYTRKYTNGPGLADLRPRESGPGENVTSDAGIEKYIWNVTYPISFHISGTASMVPKELGGVVGSDLKVYGVKGLRVVDTSLFPLIPATHLTATVYAVAEKAADIIKMAL
ncbi:FAD/NAD(P)-binding domain-containing protein, partial [Lindgomyces ingoldianus]